MLLCWTLCLSPYGLQRSDCDLTWLWKQQLAQCYNGHLSLSTNFFQCRHSLIAISDSDQAMCCHHCEICKFKISSKKLDLIFVCVCFTSKGTPHRKKTFSFGHWPNKGGGLPMPGFFGPIFYQVIVPKMAICY